MRVMPAPDAPPGAPIGGDPGMDWLAPAPAVHLERRASKLVRLWLGVVPGSRARR